MRKDRVIDVLVVFGVILLVAAALAPVVAKARRSYAEARCQSNMQRIAEAISTYLVDFRGYPTQRPFIAGTRLPQTSVSYNIRLSPLEYEENGEPYRYWYGITWIEALYPYVMKTARSRDQDWQSVFRCPNAKSIQHPPGSTTARVTYVLNYNLLDQHPGMLCNREKLMMIREIDRQINSQCRPMNISTGNSGAPPQIPFLSLYDSMLSTTGPMTPELHGNGSHIMFADGHVQYFDLEYFPYTLTAPNCWDSETNQWWNYGPGAQASSHLTKTIAITP